MNSLAFVAEPIRFNDGQVWNAWIDYNGTSDDLEVRWSLSSDRPSAAQLSHNVDLDQFGQSQGFVGFTSATGSGFGNHDILRWVFVGEFAPIPEPSALRLGTLAVGRLLKRRRE